MSHAPLPSLDRLLDFQRLLMKFHDVKRVVHFIDGTQENDIEHSFALAMTGWFIAQYFPELHIDKVIRYSLVHDLVEVHAGDTYIYADAALLASKVNREAVALKQLAHDWSDFPELMDDIKAYETHDTPESAFVYALDKIMPIMQIYINDGYTWKQEKITLNQLHKNKKDKITLSAPIEYYYNQLYQLLERSPHLIVGC